MESDDKGVVFSKGINFKELMTSGTEFQIDVDFDDKKKKSDPLLIDENDLYNEEDGEDSDAEEVLKSMEKTLELNLLASPEYKSFDELSAKMTDCVPSGDVKMLILEEGDGPLVPLDSEVMVHYAAYWERESIPFDSTMTANYGAAVKFRLGSGSWLPGLEIGITSIRGPKARFNLLLTPKMSWGERGVPPRIKPERALFTVILDEVRDVAAVHRFNDLPAEEQKKFDVTIKTVTASNQQAKEYFKKSLYKKAVKNYHKSISVLQISSPENEEQMCEIKKRLSAVYINLAVCYSKLNLPNKILLFCDELSRVVDVNLHCKGLFYYGKAFSMLGQYEEAIKFYKKALKLEPKNADIGKAMSQLNEKLNVSSKKEREMWRAVFQNGVSEKNDDLTDGLDDEFKKNLTDTCQSLAGSDGFSKIDLPSGLLKDEIDYIKKLITNFEGIQLVEELQGRNKKLSLIKIVT